MVMTLSHRLQLRLKVKLFGFRGNARVKFRPNFAPGSIGVFPSRMSKLSIINKKTFQMVKLNNGMEIPEMGLGTCFGSPEEMKQAVQWAIDIGYR